MAQMFINDGWVDAQSGRTYEVKNPATGTAWYVKVQPTFSDAIALVHYHFWTTMKFVNSPAESRFRLIPDAILVGLAATICFAA